MPLDPKALKVERDKLKEGLRDLEVDQRKLETEIKALRQQEIQTKREIEALTTLIEIHESRHPDKKPEES